MSAAFKFSSIIGNTINVTLLNKYNNYVVIITINKF